MPEIGTSGSMSGDGKRGVAEWPKLPRPSSTYMRPPLSRGVFRWCLAILIAFGYGCGRAVKPRSRERCAEGAGLEGAPTSVTSYWRSQILSYSVTPAAV
jgi:hypothetical protein